MRMWTLVLSLIALGAGSLPAQDSTQKAQGSFTFVATRMWEDDDGGRITQLLVRSGRMAPRQGHFEWSLGVAQSGGVGGLVGEAGGALSFGPREATLLLRGGVSTIVAGYIPVGAYGGVSLLLGDVSNTSLRIDLTRHSYAVSRQTISFWVTGIGITWRPGLERPTDTDR